jgi:hypothetical protein
MKFQLNDDVTEGAIVFTDEELEIIKKNGNKFVFKRENVYTLTNGILGLIAHLQKAIKDEERKDPENNKFVNDLEVLPVDLSKK